MILHCDLSGGVQSVPSSVPMGAILDDVVIIAPHTCSTVVLKIKPPYQEYIPDISCAPVLTVGEDGNNLVVFKAALPKSITGTAGRAEYQVLQTSGNGKTVATYAGSFNVSRGVLVDMPEDVYELEQYSLNEIYNLLSNVSLVFNQLVTIENLIGYPNEELTTAKLTIIGAINDLDALTKAHGIKIGEGEIIQPDDITQGESGLIALANYVYRTLKAHISDDASVEGGTDPHNTRAAISARVAEHDTDTSAHPAIRSVVESNKNRITSAEGEIENIKTDVGTANLNTQSKNLKNAMNEVYQYTLDNKDHARRNSVNITGLTAQVAGIGRSYAIPTFFDFIDFINGTKSIVFQEDRNGDGVAETITITIADVNTGDNLLIIEPNVPDFWFEKDASGVNVEEYTYDGTTYSLLALKDGVTYGSMHILEGDYALIVDRATAASQSAAEAKQSEETSAAYLDSIEVLADSIYINQKAPPISLLSTAIVLTTPTLAQLS